MMAKLGGHHCTPTQAHTMLDFSMCRANAVWKKTMYVKYTTSLGAKVRAERQGKIRLAHARTCGVTKACTSKWQTMPLDHAQLTSTYHIGL